MNPISRQWLSLLLTSLVLCCILYALHMPASVLLGCMLAGMWMGFREIRLVLPGHAFALGQGMVGCLIAKSLQWPMLERLAGDWPFFLSITVSILAASAVLGWLLMRMKILPGSTAVWGLAPGAASAMVLMSEDFGADMRLVAFMQYLRVVVVTALASLVAHVGNHHAGAPVPDIAWLELHSAWDGAMTLLVVLAGVGFALRFRVPGGPCCCRF